MSIKNQISIGLVLFLTFTGLGVLVGLNAKMTQEQTFQKLTLEEGIDAANHVLTMPAFVHRMETTHDISITTKILMPVIEQLTFLAIDKMDIPRVSYETLKNMRDVNDVYILVNGLDVTKNIEAKYIPQITCFHTTKGDWMVSLTSSTTNIVTGPGLDPLLNMCQKAKENHPIFISMEKRTDA